MFNNMLVFISLYFLQSTLPTLPSEDHAGCSNSLIYTIGYLDLCFNYKGVTAASATNICNKGLL